MCSSDSDLLCALEVEVQEDVLKLVPKGEGREAYASSATLTVPGHVATHRLRTEGGKHTDGVC